MRPKDAEKAKPTGGGARRRLVAEAPSVAGGGNVPRKQKKGRQDVEDEKAKYLAELSTDINAPNLRQAEIPRSHR